MDGTTTAAPAFKIRKAHAREIDDLDDLWLRGERTSSVGPNDVAPSASEVSRRKMRRLSMSIAAFAGKVFVATDGDRIIGIARCDGARSPFGGPAPRGVMDLTEVAVVPELRGNGIGTSLVRACTELARELEMHTLRTEVTSENEEARRLVSSLGFRPVRGVWADDSRAVQRYELILTEEIG
jgi:ribosomal protein S18 acetylase RimI-like enzyme